MSGVRTTELDQALDRMVSGGDEHGDTHSRELEPLLEISRLLVEDAAGMAPSARQQALRAELLARIVEAPVGRPRVPVRIRALVVLLGVATLALPTVALAASDTAPGRAIRAAIRQVVTLPTSFGETPSRGSTATTRAPADAPRTEAPVREGRDARAGTRQLTAQRSGDRSAEQHERRTTGRSRGRGRAADVDDAGRGRHEDVEERPERAIDKVRDESEARSDRASSSTSGSAAVTAPSEDDVPEPDDEPHEPVEPIEPAESNDAGEPDGE